MTKARSGRNVSLSKLSGWENRFRNYRSSPDSQMIRDWIDQFSALHLALAEKLLDNVELFSEMDIQRGYREAAKRTPLQQARSNGNTSHNGRVFVLGFGSPGESGPAMVRLFREATGLAARNYNEIFHSLRDLPGLRLTAYDTLIFVDDFSGTGEQATSLWPTIQELISSDAKCLLLLSATTAIAKRKIEQESNLRIIASRTLKDEENIFHDSCKKFSPEEKREILKYCLRADKQMPRGYGDCGLLFVLSHKTPNNSLPILHKVNKEWKGLFPRYLLPPES